MHLSEGSLEIRYVKWLAQCLALAGCYFCSFIHVQGDIEAIMMSCNFCPENKQLKSSFTDTGSYSFSTSGYLAKAQAEVPLLSSPSSCGSREPLSCPSAQSRRCVELYCSVSTGHSDFPLEGVSCWSLPPSSGKCAELEKRLRAECCLAFVYLSRKKSPEC